MSSIPSCGLLNWSVMKSSMLSFQLEFTGGDGNYRVLLEQIREQHELMDRVTLLGGLDHSQVRDVSCHLLTKLIDFSSIFLAEI